MPCPISAHVAAPPLPIKISTEAAGAWALTCAEGPVAGHCHLFLSLLTLLSLHVWGAHGVDSLLYLRAMGSKGKKKIRILPSLLLHFFHPGTRAYLGGGTVLEAHLRRTQPSIRITPPPQGPGLWFLNQTCRFLCPSHRLSTWAREALWPHVFIFMFSPFI